MLKDIQSYASFKTLFTSYSDDIVDKLNHVYTTAIILIFATVVTTSQFVGDPIICWTPAEFTGAYTDYAKRYCWIKNTYFLPMMDTIPVDINKRANAEITYYQWVPLILLFMAFMFKFPNLLWKLLSTHTGFSFRDATKLANSIIINTQEDGQQATDKLGRLFNLWLRSQIQYKHNFLVKVRHRVSKFAVMFCSKREGQFLSAVYFNVKILYLLNVIGQFFLLGAFLDVDYKNYGFYVISGLAEEEPWPESPRFPRITLCDFRIRQLQNVQRYTVQCVLPINLFNEKIFIFLWFWFFLVALVTGINFVKWCILLIVRKNNYLFIKKYLKITNNIEGARDRTAAKAFVKDYLRDDGCLVLRLLAKNSSDLVVIELVSHLWRSYKVNPSLHLIQDDEETELKFSKSSQPFLDNKFEANKHAATSDLSTISEEKEEITI